MMEKMKDPNIIDYYITNRAIPSTITIENRNQIDFGMPTHVYECYYCRIKVIRGPLLTKSQSGGVIFYLSMGSRGCGTA